MRKLAATQITETSVRSPSPEIPQPRSAWHSPVPYLFGGLGAMLGLIAFALLILACSYGRVAGQLSDAERDLERGARKEAESVKAPKVLEQKFVVIMAGDDKPSFLATPVSVFDPCGDEENEEEGREETEEGEKAEKEVVGDHEHVTVSENRVIRQSEEDGD